jgi:hypothetical protein
MKGLLTFATSLLLLLAAAGPANAQFIPGIEFIEIEKFGDGLPIHWTSRQQKYCAQRSQK